MWTTLTAIAVVLGLGGAAFAQSSGGSTSSGSGSSASSSNSTGVSDRLPGQTGRSDVAPGSRARPRAAGGSRVPMGESAADQSRRGGGTSDLNSNSATGVPGMNQGVVSSGSMDRSGPVPLGPGTGARDRGVPDSSVYNPGVNKR